MSRIITKNLMEDFVDVLLDDCLHSMEDMCHCEQCKEDVRAFALNKLPSQYVVTTSGKMFVRVNTMSLQAQADITSAIMQGMRIVKNNPRHNLDETDLMMQMYRGVNNPAHAAGAAEATGTKE